MKKYEFAEKDSETTEILIKAFSDILEVITSLARGTRAPLFNTPRRFPASYAWPFQGNTGSLTRGD